MMLLARPISKIEHVIVHCSVPFQNGRNEFEFLWLKPAVADPLPAAIDIGPHKITGLELDVRRTHAVDGVDEVLDGMNWQPMRDGQRPNLSWFWRLGHGVSSLVQQTRACHYFCWRSAGF